VKVNRTRLDNGLTILSEEMHAAPVVALQAWVHVGSADEDESIAGIAHVHEHMLFKGTERRGVGEIARTVEASGGEINAWTSFDQTVYHIVLSTEELSTGLDILADALTASAFDAEELAREIEVVIEEIKRSDDSPTRRLSNALFAAAYQAHPYSRPVIGSVQTIRALTRERILAFFRDNYRPENVTLVAVGDFDTATLVDKVQNYFGHWNSGCPTLPPRAMESPCREARLRVLREPVKETRFTCAWHIPEVDHEDIAALDALAVILGHGESSRLYREARHRRELVNDVYAYAYTPRDPGLFMVGAGLRFEHLEAALCAVLRETYRVRIDRVSDGELEKAKVIVLSEAAYQRETVQGQARKLGFFEVVAGDFAFEERYYEKLRSLTPENLRVVAARYLTDKPVLVVQTPDDEPAANEDHLRELVIEAWTHSSAASVRARSCGSLDVTRVELDNGAIILARREETPVVAMRALALGGLRWETKSTQGLSRLFSSLWGQTTDSLTIEAMAQQTALLGGFVSAFAGRNSVGLRGEFIREKSEQGLELFGYALVSRAFREDDLERERAVILERIRNREDSPAVIAFDVFASELFPNHPYGLRSIGTEESVQSFDLPRVLAYGAEQVTSDRMVVCVVGDVDVDRVIDGFAPLLGEAPTSTMPAAPVRDPPPTTPRRTRYTLDKNQAHVIIGAMGTTVEDPDRHALEVLTTVLSGQSGRLFLDLRDNQSLAYAISASSLEGLDPGHIMVHVGTSPDKVDKALAGVYGHLERLRQDPVPEDELDRARTYLIGTHAIDLQRGGARAMLMCLGEAFGLGYDQYARYSEQIRGVTSADVQRVAQIYLGAERLVEAIVGPKTS